MPTWRILIGLILSAMGTFFSCSAFVFFFYGNYHAAIWALISGVLAAVDFHLLFLSWRNTLSSWHNVSTMKDFEVLAVVGLVLGIGGGIWYIFVFLYYNLPLLPINTSYQIASVWAFMTAKWGFGLLLTAKHLVKELREDHPDLLSSPAYIRSSNYYNRVAA